MRSHRGSRGQAGAAAAAATAAVADRRPGVVPAVLLSATFPIEVLVSEFAALPSLEILSDLFVRVYSYLSHYIFLNRYMHTHTPIYSSRDLSPSANNVSCILPV